jgi:small subunit ribosomal protein S2
MSDISMRDMLEAGVHFGHQTKFWNPKMKPYIFGVRSNVHIIDLQQSLPMFQEAIKFTKELAAKGGIVLFVGSKRSAKKSVEDYAKQAGMPYVCNRWLGGMLTNFETIKKSIKRLKYLEEVFASEELKSDFGKRELLTLSRELEKFEKTLGGIKDMKTLPDALFMIDVRYEKIAVKEASKLGIPVIGVVDTNSSPDDIAVVIPGNDDSIASIKLYSYGIAKAITEGRAQLPIIEDAFVEQKEEVKTIVTVKPVAKAKPEVIAKLEPEEAKPEVIAKLEPEEAKPEVIAKLEPEEAKPAVKAKTAAKAKTAVKAKTAAKAKTAVKAKTAAKAKTAVKAKTAAKVTTKKKLKKVELDEVKATLPEGKLMDDIDSDPSK